MEDLEIWQTAKILIDAHGDHAAMEAAMRADHALEEGKLEVVEVWKRVMKAVEELQRKRPHGDEHLN